MAAVPQEQQPTPERFFNTVNAYQQTEAMKAAIELEIFAAIAEGCTTAAAIASRCQAAERGVRILCDFLTIHGYLTKDGVPYGLARFRFIPQPAFPRICRHGHRVSSDAPLARSSRAAGRSRP